MGTKYSGSVCIFRMADGLICGRGVDRDRMAEFLRKVNKSDTYYFVTNEIAAKRFSNQ